MTYNKEENYCSFSPDKLFGVNFNYACYLHDRQYRNEVKVRKTRKQSDVDFKNKIFQIFRNKNKQLIGRIVSKIYYIFIRIFGNKSWK